VFIHFIAELTSNKRHNSNELFIWVFSEVILEGPDGVLVEKSLKFSFKANNNQVEYEALLVEMILIKKMGIQKLSRK